jgi:hypothetical protein
VHERWSAILFRRCVCEEPAHIGIETLVTGMTIASSSQIRSELQSVCDFLQHTGSCQEAT